MWFSTLTTHCKHLGNLKKKDRLPGPPSTPTKSGSLGMQLRHGKVLKLPCETMCSRDEKDEMKTCSSGPLSLDQAQLTMATWWPYWGMTLYLPSAPTHRFSLRLTPRPGTLAWGSGVLILPQWRSAASWPLEWGRVSLVTKR